MGPGSKECGAGSVSVQGESMIDGSQLRSVAIIDHPQSPLTDGASMIEPTELMFLAQIKQPQNAHVNRKEINSSEIPDRPCPKVAKHFCHRMRRQATGKYGINQRSSRGAERHNPAKPGSMSSGSCRVALHTTMLGI